MPVHKAPISQTLKTLVTLLILYTLGVSCDTGTKSATTGKVMPINPNGDSELALLMRSMYDETLEVKQRLAHGDSTIDISLDHEALLSAHGTEPEKVSSDEYKAFAQMYLQAQEHLNTTSPDQRMAAYTHLVDVCTSCHRSMCPGPLVRIKKLGL